MVVVALFGRLKASRDVASPASDAMALTSTTARREGSCSTPRRSTPRVRARSHPRPPPPRRVPRRVGRRRERARGTRRRGVGVAARPHVARRLVHPSRRRSRPRRAGVTQRPFPILRRRPPPPPLPRRWRTPRRHLRGPRPHVDPRATGFVVQPTRRRVRGERRRDPSRGGARASSSAASSVTTEMHAWTSP